MLKTLTYWKPWYIQNPELTLDLFQILKSGIFKTLVYTEPWYVHNQSHIHNLCIFRTSNINICNRTFYESNAIFYFIFFLNMVRYNLSETTRNKTKLLFYIRLYWGIIRNILVKTHSEASVIVVYPYAWDINNPYMFRG